VADPAEMLVLEVPRAWDEVEGGLYPGSGKTVGVALAASTNVKQFTGGSFSVPGVQLIVSKSWASEYNPASFLEDWGDRTRYTANCSENSASDYNHPNFKGRYEFYTGCGSSTGTFLIMALQAKAGQDYLVSIVARDLQEDDIHHLVDTFQVNGTLP
jgi:hypothetical protein